MRIAVLMMALAAPAGAEEYSIAGAVVSALDAGPVARALVQISGTTVAGSRAALTDAGGAFHFAGLPAGAYSLAATKPGYWPERSPVAATVTLGPSRDGVVLKLTPLASLAGKVTDAYGEPVEGVVVEALALRVVEGRRQVRRQSSAVTDDRGQYRMAHLAPGRYQVRASSRGGGVVGYVGDTAPRMGQRESFAPVLYPSVVAAAAGREERADLTLLMQPAWRIRGQLLNYEPYTQPYLELLRGDDDVAAARVSVEASSGRFEIQDLVPGQYTLRATSGDGPRRLRGERAVTVTAADVSNVAIELAPGLDLEGRLTMTGEVDPALNARCAVTLRPVLPQESDMLSMAYAREDGRLQFHAVMPGRYLVEFACGAGYVSAATWGGQELLADNRIRVMAGAAPRFDITVRTDSGTVAGTVAAEGAAGRVRVVLSDSGGAGQRATETEPGGPFTFQNVRPGEYRVYAFPADEEIEYDDPAALARAGLEAQDVRVGARERVTVALKVRAPR
jgi:protocatechuate 3,4-dioxygenase beta subunit